MKENNIIYFDKYRERKTNYYPVLESTLERVERLLEENQKKSDEVLRGAIELMTKMIELSTKYKDAE